MSQTAFQYAIKLLSIRDYSEFKITTKLKDRGFDHDDIINTIERLKNLNYLREEEYLRIRIKQLLVKGHSNQYILLKCHEEKINPSEELINSIRVDQGLDSSSAITRLIDKKLRYKNIPQDFKTKQKLKAKVANFLLTKGHNLSESLPLIESYLKQKEIMPEQED